MNAMLESELRTATCAAHLFTVDEFAKMLRAEALDPNKKFELIEGALFEMTAMDSPHFAAVMRLNHLLVEKLGKAAQVSVQSPIRLSSYSAPEPDLVALRPSEDFYAADLPSASDALLVVEVSGSTLRRDKEVKMPLYARHNIPELWIVNLSELRLEVYREPKDGIYRQILIFDDTQRISPLKFPNDFFSVAEILGTKPMR